MTPSPEDEVSAASLREPSTTGPAPGVPPAGEQGRGAGHPGFPRSRGRRRVTALAANQGGACLDALLGRRPDASPLRDELAAGSACGCDPHDSPARPRDPQGEARRPLLVTGGRLELSGGGGEVLRAGKMAAAAGGIPEVAEGE